MGKEVRILQVIGVMNRGGAEAMIMNLYRKIDRTKIQFDFVEHSSEHAAFDDEITALGGRIYHCPQYRITNHAAYKKWWRDFFREYGGEYQVIHGHIGSTAAIYLKIANQYGLYTIAHSHSSKSPVLTLKSSLYRILSYPTRNIADHFFACSKIAAIDRFGKTVANGNRCDLLNNAIDTQKFVYSPSVRQEVQKELGLSDDLFVVGVVGSIYKDKNPLGTVEIFKAVHDMTPDARLLWAGGGPMRVDVENKAKEYGIQDAVILAGVRPDVHRLMQVMDVFIMPSLYEGLPVAGVEAQAAGLPCIFSSTISTELQKTDLCKFLPLDNYELWAQEVLSAKVERRDMSEQIREAGYDIHTTAEWLQNFYFQCIKKPKTKTK